VYFIGENGEIVFEKMTTLNFTLSPYAVLFVVRVFFRYNAGAHIFTIYARVYRLIDCRRRRFTALLRLRYSIVKKTRYSVGRIIIIITP